MKKVITILILLIASLLSVHSCGTARKGSSLPMEKRSIYMQDHVNYYAYDLKTTETEVMSVLDSYLDMTVLEGDIVKKEFESVTFTDGEMNILCYVETTKKLYQIVLVIKDYVRFDKKPR